MRPCWPWCPAVDRCEVCRGGGNRRCVWLWVFDRGRSGGARTIQRVERGDASSFDTRSSTRPTGRCFVVRLPQPIRGLRPVRAGMSAHFARGTAVQTSASWHERKAHPGRTRSDAGSGSLSALYRLRPMEVDPLPAFDPPLSYDRSRSTTTACLRIVACPSSALAVMRDPLHPAQDERPFTRDADVNSHTELQSVSRSESASSELASHRSWGTMRRLSSLR
jgi:hypothetical protein